MRELSVAEQRYQAVLAVISDGLSISQVAGKVGVSRQTLHMWLARYEAEGLEGLVDRSHRPGTCPHQMPADVEARLLELRRSRPYWGPRRLVFELADLPAEQRCQLCRETAANYVVKSDTAGGTRAARCRQIYVQQFGSRTVHSATSASRFGR
jgi:transposase-like protein